MAKKVLFNKSLSEEGAFNNLPASKGAFKPKKAFDPEATQSVNLEKYKTNPVEQPAFKKPEEPRKPLKASAEASKFLRKIGPATKLDSPFDKANKEVDKMAAGVHKDTTSVAGRMKAAGLPSPKAGFTAPAKPNTADLKSPDVNKAYQHARSAGISSTTNLERPAVWRAQEKLAAGQGVHDYNVAKHSAPVAPKAKTDPIASQEPQGAGSDPIASQKTSAAPVETPAPSSGSSSMADNPAPKEQAAASAAPAGFTKPGEGTKLKRERQTTPRGNKVAGEPIAPAPSAKPPKPPAGPPPLKMATPEYQKAQEPSPTPKTEKPAKAEEPKVAAPAPTTSQKTGSNVGNVSKSLGKGLEKLRGEVTHLGGKVGRFIKGTTKVRKY